MPSDVTSPADSKSIEATPRFEDGLGVRLATTDAFGEPIEHLKVCADLAALDSAIRERVSRLINFRHVRYVRLRGTERRTNPEKDFVIAYDAVTGARLSELLDLASHTPLRMDIDVAMQIVRELLPAVAVLHDSRNVTHGAIATERLVITNQGRLVIVDHGLGLALGKLGYSRRRYWQQLGVAVPSGSGKVLFDARTDVIQIGVVALALILGRQIGRDEYPDDVRSLVGGARELTAKGDWRAMSSELQSWLERMLPTEHRQPFMTVREAQQAFETLVSQKRYAPSAAALKTVITRYYSLIEGKGLGATPDSSDKAAVSERVSEPISKSISATVSEPEPKATTVAPVVLEVKVKVQPPAPPAPAVPAVSPAALAKPPAAPAASAPVQPAAPAVPPKAATPVAKTAPPPQQQPAKTANAKPAAPPTTTSPATTTTTTTTAPVAPKATVAAPPAPVQPPAVPPAAPPATPVTPVKSATVAPPAPAAPPATTPVKPTAASAPPVAPPAPLAPASATVTQPATTVVPPSVVEKPKPVVIAPPPVAAAPPAPVVPPAPVEPAAKKPAAPPTALKGTLDETTLPQIAARPGRSARVSEPPMTLSSEPETSTASPSGLEIGPIADSVTPTRRRARRALVIPIDDSMSREALTRASKLAAASSKQATQPPKPIVSKPVVPVQVAKASPPPVPVASSLAQQKPASTPVPPVIATVTPVAPSRDTVTVSEVESSLSTLAPEIDAPTIPSRSLIPAIVATASTPRAKTPPPAVPQEPTKKDDQVLEALRGLERDDPARGLFDKDILIGRRHDDAEPITIAHAGVGSIEGGPAYSRKSEAPRTEVAVVGAPEVKAPVVAAKMPEPEVALAPELTAFEQVAEDTYQHAEVSLALKDLVPAEHVPAAPAGKTGSANIDANAILQMTAVDDATMLSSSSQLAVEAPVAAMAPPLRVEVKLPADTDTKPATELKPAAEVKPAAMDVKPVAEAKSPIQIQVIKPAAARPPVPAAPPAAKPVAPPQVAKPVVPAPAPPVAAAPPVVTPAEEIIFAATPAPPLTPAVAPPLPVLPLSVQAKVEPTLVKVAPPQTPVQVEKTVAPAPAEKVVPAAPIAALDKDKKPAAAAIKPPVVSVTLAPTVAAPLPAVAPPAIVPPPPAAAPPVVSPVASASPVTPAPRPATPSQVLTTPVAPPVVVSTVATPPVAPVVAPPSPVIVEPVLATTLVTPVAKPPVAVNALPVTPAPVRAETPAPPAPVAPMPAATVPVATVPVATIPASPVPVPAVSAPPVTAPVTSVPVMVTPLAAAPERVTPVAPVVVPPAVVAPTASTLTISTSPAFFAPTSDASSTATATANASVSVSENVAASANGKTKKTAAAVAAFWNVEEAPEDAVLPAWARGVEPNGAAAPDPAAVIPSGPLGTPAESTSAYTALGPPVAPVSTTAPGSRLRMWLRRSKGGGGIGLADMPDTSMAAGGSAYRIAPSLTSGDARSIESSGSSTSLLNAGGGFLGTAAVEESTSRFVATRRALPRVRVNWRRTLAASCVVALLEGVAFGTAYWYVVPTETGSLIVETTPPGIDILVDGRVSGHTPFSGALTPGRHTIELRQGTNSRVLPVEISGGVQTWQRITWSKGLRTGQARVTSTAPNARVTLDGNDLGVTPLTISTLSAGKHMVTVESTSGTVNTPMSVSPGETTELDVPVYPGWVSVLASVELQIFEGERFLGTTESEKLLLVPGRHKLDFVSASLGYRHSQSILVTPGSTAALSIVMPKVAVEIDGQPGTELYVDGDVVGKLPMKDLRLALGTREFVFKLPDGSTRRQVVVLTNKAPMKVSAPQ